MALNPLNALEVYYGKSARRVSLSQGDITGLTAGEAVDYLVVSAPPNNYAPTADPIIGALYRRGISVQTLAQDKQVSYLPHIPCWISKPISGQGFKRLLVFEPQDPERNGADMAAYILSAIATYEKEAAHPIKVALPLVCTGYAKVSPVDMVEALFYSAVHWGAMALPFAEINIVAHTPELGNLAAKVFAGLKNRYQNMEGLTFSEAYYAYANIVSDYIKTIDPGPTLTKRQQFGICMYTTNYYAVINRILRENDPRSQEYRDHMPLFEATDTGLMNLPPYFNKPVYRGESNMTPQRLKQHQPGASIPNPGYTSTAYEKGWFYYTDFRFDLQSLAGRNIEGLSYFPGEKEILFYRGMVYTVKSVSQPSYYLFTADEQQVSFWR